MAFANLAKKSNEWPIRRNLGGHLGNFSLEQLVSKKRIGDKSVNSKASAYQQMLTRMKTWLNVHAPLVKRILPHHC